MTPAAVPIASSLVRRRLADYVALGKPRIVIMVLLTTCVGYYLGSEGAPVIVGLAHALAGTACAAAGTLALNQYLERERDARMERTRHRPLADGRLPAGEALVVGLALMSAGIVYLSLFTNGLAALVTTIIAATYLLVYTPLKPVTSLSVLVGAVPGALPPVVGWASARGELGPEAWVLFGIMFLWQVPHTLAVGRVFRDDYARAGIQVLPVVDRDGVRTGVHAVTNCLALIPVALLPTLIGLAGSVYFLSALVLGVAFLLAAVPMARSRSTADARRLLLASLLYLPILLAVMALDKLPS
jgi:protoheme IX farnesyltransferase